MWFYENGVTSVNLPLCAQEVGGRATRTTHPRAVHGLGALLSLVARSPVAVRNGFFWKTKQDVLEVLRSGGHSVLSRRSVSCSHTRWAANASPHCGLCSQCLARRVAAIGAAYAGDDPAEGYRTDPLTGERAKDHERILAERFLAEARAVARMKAVRQFDVKYAGHLARVYPYLDMPTPVAAERLFDLHLRHAEQVSLAVETAVRTHFMDAWRGRAGATSALSYAFGLLAPGRPAAAQSRAGGAQATPDDRAASEPEAEPRPPAADHVFRRKGEAWVFRFAGGEEFVLRPTRGAAYLHLLLASPGTAHSVFALVLGVTRAPATFILGDAGERNDDRVRAEYAARFAEFEEELSEATANHDEAAAERARRDMTVLADELQDRSWGGRPKRERDDRERIRKAFQAAVGRAVDDVGRWDRRLADHLKAAVRCGLRPTYDPQGPLPDWDL